MLMQTHSQRIFKVKVKLNQNDQRRPSTETVVCIGQTDEQVSRQTLALPNTGLNTDDT